MEKEKKEKKKEKKKKKKKRKKRKEKKRSLYVGKKQIKTISLEKKNYRSIRFMKNITENIFIWLFFWHEG